VRRTLVKAAAWLLLLLVAAAANAANVGELHRTAFDRTAALRDAQHRAVLRITVWYPASADAVEQNIVIGPAEQPLFEVGRAAPDAPFATSPRNWPVILLSHGYGGSARVMGWLGIALARDGYIVVAVDHPGNNGAEPMTVAGATLWWDRAEDLRVALDAIARDRTVGPHADLSRVGVAGFSAGGYTSLIAAGARIEPQRFVRFCETHPGDDMCKPQPELAVTRAQFDELLTRPEIRAELAHASDDHSIAQVRAVFVMAPALVQALRPASLAALATPVQIVVGDDDTTAPAATNAVVAAQRIPDALLMRLPGVTHYDFLADCTAAGRAAVPVCARATRQDDVHRLTIHAAQSFFDARLAAAH